MAAKNQHFVPRVYLKSWETPDSYLSKSNKKLQSIFIFDKSDISLGELRKTNKILFLRNAYTVEWKHLIFCTPCKLIIKDFEKQIRAHLEDFEAVASLDNRLLSHREILNRCILESEYLYNKINSFQFLYKKSKNPLSTGKSNDLLTKMQNVRSNIIEDAFAKRVEDSWKETLKEFIEPSEEKGVFQNAINKYNIVRPEVMERMISMLVFMLIRNPAFRSDLFFPSLEQQLCKVLPKNEATDEEKQAFYLLELYNAFFKKRGVFQSIAKKIADDFQCVLIRVSDDATASFITSDNPVIIYGSRVTTKNWNGFYFPLTPLHTLYFGVHPEGSMKKFKIIHAPDPFVKTINQIIFSGSQKYVVSTKKDISTIL